MTHQELRTAFGEVSEGLERVIKAIVESQSIVSFQGDSAAYIRCKGRLDLRTVQETPVMPIC